MHSPSLSPVQELLNQTLSWCEQCLRRDDFSSAWRALGAAVALAPDNAVVLSHRGHLALFLKDLETAGHDFAEALKLAPAHSSAWAGLARYHWLKGERVKAEAAADRALALDPTDEVAAQVKTNLKSQREPLDVRQASGGQVLSHDQSQGARGLVVIQEKGFRRQPLLIQGVRHWCTARGIPVAVIDHDGFYAGQWEIPKERIGAFYLPITERYEPMERIPRQYPVIVDFDANGSSNISSVDLTNLRYAVRNAFGMRVAAKQAPEFQVPYLHRPNAFSGAADRDVIIVDVKPFHGMPAQAAVLALIAGIAEEYPRICLSRVT